MSNAPRRPRVLIADDDARIHTAATQLLSPSCDVVGSVSDIDALLLAAPRLRPDVVLLDFSLRGDLNAIEVCRRVKLMLPPVHVVAFTAHDDPDLRRAAQEAGASGFVWKLNPDELMQTIQRVTGMDAAGGGTG